jgi:GDP-D-mannose dehydratase
MSSLIIGNTSQLSNYFPENYDKISSRNIDLDRLKSKKYESIYLLFAEQRTYLNRDLNFFSEINFDYTIKIINELKDFSNRLVIYSTSELWNNVNGCASVKDPFNYNETPYIKSKELLCNYIKENRNIYSNVIIIYPFNFNSIYRKEGFLFSKIYKSILNDEKISIGNIDFNRDLIHPKTIVKYSIESNEDLLIGSGELINVKCFVQDLFKVYNRKFEDYISVEDKNNLSNVRKDYFSCVKYSNYEELLNLTINDIYEYKISKGHHQF